MSNKQLCNRCNERYKKRYGGQLQLNYGHIEAEARLCRDCYEDVLTAYREDY